MFLGIILGLFGGAFILMLIMLGVIIRSGRNESASKKDIEELVKHVSEYNEQIQTDK